MARIKEQLESDPAQMIEIVEDMDEICAACPHNIGGVCDTQEKVDRYDAAVLRYAAGASDENTTDHQVSAAGKLQMPYQRYADLVKEKILDAGRREEICGDCAWSEICR